MERFGTFLYGAMGYLLGAALIVAGWWLSMLNISIDSSSNTGFTNFWTFLGLAMIFLGAYLPMIVVKVRGRRVSQRQALRARADAAGTQALPPQPGQPTTGTPPDAAPSSRG